MEQDNEKRKGRPKVTDKETKSKTFTMKIKSSIFRELNRICGLRQLKTGKRTSVSDLINTVMEEYVQLHGIKEIQ